MPSQITSLVPKPCYNYGQKLLANIAGIRILPAVSNTEQQGSDCQSKKDASKSQVDGKKSIREKAKEKKQEYHEKEKGKGKNFTPEDCVQSLLSTPINRIGKWWIKYSSLSLYRSIKGIPTFDVTGARENKVLKQLMKGVSEKINGQFIDLCTKDKQEWMRLKKSYKQIHYYKGKKQSYTNGQSVIFMDCIRKDIKTMIKINLEEHLEIYAEAKGEGLKDCLVQSLRLQNWLHECLKETCNEIDYKKGHGYVNSANDHFGVAMTARVQMVIPNLTNHKLWSAILNHCHLRKTFSYHNKRRGYQITGLELDLTDGHNEIEAIQKAHQTFSRIVEMERNLDKGHSIRHLLPGNLRNICDQTMASESVLKDTKMTSLASDLYEKPYNLWEGGFNLHSFHFLIPSEPISYRDSCVESSRDLYSLSEGGLVSNSKLKKRLKINN